MTTTPDSEMSVQEMLEHLEEIKNKQKTVQQDYAVKFAISVIEALVICRWCDGTGMITVPDENQESASEQACPNPLHEIEANS